jgi:hypothetical protein
MQLLQAIYTHPSQLLEKAKRDGAALKKALAACNEPDTRDALFNFAVSAYHIRDWVQKLRPELSDAADDLLNREEGIGVCRDLCNASKHIEIDPERGAYKAYPPVTDAVSVSSVASYSPSDVASMLAGMIDPRPAWRLKIQTVKGRRIAAEVLIQTC